MNRVEKDISSAEEREDYKEKGLVFWKTSKEPATLTSTDLLCWTRTIDRTRRLIKRTLFFFFFLIRKNNMDKKKRNLNSGVNICI